MPQVDFHPRRLGHVNVYGDDFMRSMDFYEKVIGIEPVCIEEQLKAAFHSNGNTHHDIGIVETSKGVDRIGRDGKIQVPKTRGVKPGLNHLGWEMENEAQLIAAYKRFQAAGLTTTALFDHQISHAIYINDPDGNVHEFYADAMKDWRRVMNMESRELMTSQWDPLAEKNPATEANYEEKPKIRKVPAAPLHPLHTTGALFDTTNFESMTRFVLDVIGLAKIEEKTEGKLRRAVFQGTHGSKDLILQEVEAGQPTGYRRFAMVLEPQTDLEAVKTRLKSQGIGAIETVEHDGRVGIVLTDPDGMQVELYKTAA